MEYKKTIKNYYFINNHNIFLIYDFENNRILPIKNKNDFYELNKVLFDYFYKNNKKSCCLNYNINYFLNNVCDYENFDTYKYLNSYKTARIGLMVAQDCNFRCKYCYGVDGKYGSNGEMMSFKTAMQAVSYMIKECPNAKQYEICFFGGEPLLNYKLIKYVIENCKKIESKKFTYTITTNGSLLNEDIIKYFHKNNVGIMISMDGDKDIHNKNRVFPNGVGTFDKVFFNVKKLINSEYKNYFHVRSTISPEFADQYENIVDFFLSIGIKKIAIAYETNYNDDSNKSCIDLSFLKKAKRAKKEYIERIKHEILNGENPKFIPFYVILYRIHQTTKDLVSCGVFKGSTMVSFDGKLYPCHRFVGMKKFDFGNVYDGVSHQKLKLMCSSLDINTKPCISCFAKYICKRSCIRDIAKNGGKFIKYDKKYCDFMRSTIEDIIIFYYKLTKKRPDYLKALE